MLPRKITKDFNGSGFEAVKLLAEGNIGALTTLMTFLSFIGKRFTKQSESGEWIETIKYLKIFDRFRLHGEPFWSFYKNTCQGSPENLFAFVHAYVNHNRYPGVREKLTEWFENNKPFDFKKLFSEVKDLEPDLFEEQELIENGNEKPITSDLLNDLKSRFR